MDSLIDRWINIARGEPKAADAVAQFARTTSIAWQTTKGLTWLDRVMNNRYDQFANRCWFLTHWPLFRWRRVVDGLAGAGDRRGVDLQRIDD
jgi:hypothetical protein